MKKLSADYILSSNGELLKNALLIVEDDGRIVELIEAIDKKDLSNRS